MPYETISSSYCRIPGYAESRTPQGWRSLFRFWRIFFDRLPRHTIELAFDLGAIALFFTGNAAPYECHVLGSRSFSANGSLAVETGTAIRMLSYCVWRATRLPIA